MTRHRVLNLFLEIFVFIVLLCILNEYSNLQLNASKLYSSSIAHRLQTNALLQGKIELSPWPFGCGHDFVWLGHGVQQNWGMGVPLLRLPFEWLGRLCGLSAFPDRLVLLFYLVLTVIVLNRSLTLIFDRLKDFKRMSFVMRWTVIGWILFCPAFGALLWRPLVYDETIFYGCLLSFSLLGLFWRYIVEQDDRIFFWLCLLAGFAWLIRPTLIFYGLTTAALSLTCKFLYKYNLRHMVAGFLIFIAAAAIGLWFNDVRFGSIFDFGYDGSLTGVAGINYVQRFDSPMHHLCFSAAFKELIGALFFHNPWKSEALRWRWYYFPDYNFSHVFLLGLGAVFLCMRAWQGLVQKTQSLHDPVLARIIDLSLWWGFISCGLFFAFYLRTPALECRYLSEFSPAFCAVGAAVLLEGLSVQTIYKNKKLAGIFFAGVAAVCFFNDREFFDFQLSPLSQNQGWVFSGKRKGVEFYNIKLNSFSANHGWVYARADLEEREHAVNFLMSQTGSLPDTVLCAKSYPSWGMSDQFVGWDQQGGCAVSASTSFILPTKRCLIVNYTVGEGAAMFEVRVKRDIDLLEYTGQRIAEGDELKMKGRNVTREFCSENLSDRRFSLYTIGWLPVDKLTIKILPITLNRVSVR